VPRHPTVALAVAGALAACTTAQAPPPGLSVSFYEVSGTTAEALDSQLRHKGPLVPGQGRALAATTVAITPAVTLEEAAGLCRVASASASASAGVRLPRWRDRQSAEAELATTWDNFERYAVIHEFVHVAIAEQHADLLEARLRALPQTANCAALRARVTRTIAEVMAAHGRAQEGFDASEQERLGRLAREARRRPNAG
jgi:predicted secreted Zn-dependent protease